MLYSESTVRDNLRNRDGKRVFYLGKGDQLTSQARDFLTRERIEILPAEAAKPQRYRLLVGGYLEEKPEHMTHLCGDLLVPKTHRRIAFRGAMDTLEAALLLGALEMPDQQKELEQLLELARQIVRCDVLDEPLEEKSLCGLTMEELRSHSHRPQDYYGKPHFMPRVSDGKKVLQLNRLRTQAREAERLAAAAFATEAGNCSRTDLLRGLNRMSSMLYILMLRAKE